MDCYIFWRSNTKWNNYLVVWKLWLFLSILAWMISNSSFRCSELDRFLVLRAFVQSTGDIGTCAWRPPALLAFTLKCRWVNFWYRLGFNFSHDFGSWSSEHSPSSSLISSSETRLQWSLNSPSDKSNNGTVKLLLSLHVIELQHVCVCTWGVSGLGLCRLHWRRCRSSFMVLVLFRLLPFSSWGVADGADGADGTVVVAVVAAFVDGVLWSITVADIRLPWSGDTVNFTLIVLLP